MALRRGKRASYWLHPRPLATILGSCQATELVVLVPVTSPNFSRINITDALSDLKQTDDVYSDDFHEALVLQYVAGFDIERVEPALNVTNLFKGVYLSQIARADEILPTGPYFVQHESVHQAWRLYSDDLDAFVTPVIPDDPLNPQSFGVLKATACESSCRSIAVPSRAYASRSRKKPLAGARVSIKDCFHLAGTRTTIMNRAYHDLYGPVKESATYVKRLIELGAVIIGKTKLCSFMSAEEPIDQWIDYSCPFNPRADGYQTSSGSTTGGAAALAGYQWLDYSVGTDTSGSIRSPASWNGLYSLRTSFESAPTEGLVMSCKEFDVVGVLSRDPESCHRLVETTMDVQESREYPEQIIYPVDFFPQSDKEQQAMTEEFIQILEKFLGVKRTKVSFRKKWREDPPQDANGKILEKYLRMSAPWPMYYDAYHNFDEFRRQYKKKFRKDAYVGPYMEARWDIAKPFTIAKREQGVHEMNVFRKWFQRFLCPVSKSSSNAIIIMPFGTATPKYRDEHNSLPKIVPSYSPFYLAPMLQVPQVVVPIGQNPYKSRVSGQLEYRPIVSTIIGAKGSDLMLLNLVQEVLTCAGWPTHVKTGQLMFDLADNIRHVAFVKQDSRRESEDNDRICNPSKFEPRRKPTVNRHRLASPENGALRSAVENGHRSVHRTVQDLAMKIGLRGRA